MSLPFPPFVSSEVKTWGVQQILDFARTERMLK
ncbi:hypothetical protein FHS93_000090 [Sphingobium francense]|nr:hypothetical protein [Sphingobium indicum]